ncbi:MAG: NAD(P)/FAD-dependent oxidoreductase, partial [Pseudomonadales bacterium]|nr:NAD(P)/FAD-dependent oxidoreductase [Pseudomonadales bacterium]
CVIGAGAVGLAIGRALALRGREVVVVDAEQHFGQGVSSRNSEVIHAGIYYPEGSLKARFCVEGKHKLYEYCVSHHVSHARCGKLIVATEEQEEETLEGILAKARANGVMDLEYWSGPRLAREEPRVRATRALFSPSTGIVSSHELMQSYLADIEDRGGVFVGGTRVVAIHREGAAFVVESEVHGEAYRFNAGVVVNSAGLGAQAVARACSFLDPAAVPPLYFCRGNYFVLEGASPFRHLIYPVPEKSGAGLGIHATIDLGGQARFGPDVEYVEDEDYVVSSARLPDYYDAVRRYFPSLADGALHPGYVGIRPKLQGPDDAPWDFVVQDATTHGVPGLVQLFGIESPGLTSSLAIADYVVECLTL